MNELDDLLIESLAENLSKKEINQLAKSNKSSKEIIVYDYLSGNSRNPGKSLIEQITSNIYSASPESLKEFRFKTPKKKMILDLFKRELCHDWSSVFTKAETKEELRQLYCLDEIYFYLDAARRERLDPFEDIAGMLNKSVKLYLGQKIASELRNQIDSFLEYEKTSDYKDLSPEKVKGILSNSSLAPARVPRSSSVRDLFS